MRYPLAQTYFVLFLTVAAKCFAVEASSTVNHEQTVNQLRKSLTKSPQSAALKQNLSIALSDWAQTLIQKKDTQTATVKLKEAVSIAPQNGPAWFALGDIAYLHDSDFKSAVQYWKKAQPLAPAFIQKQIAERISRAELDKHLEQGYVSLATQHFDIRFAKDFSKSEAERIGKYMEGEYAKFSAELKASPEKLTLIIYQKQSFDRVTGAHDETLGLYDGRIRIAASEVGRSYEAIILSHELGHAFLQHAFGNGLPIWIQEGYAQAKEPGRLLTEEENRIEKELKSGNGWIPLKWLDRKFSQPTNLEDVSRSYLESRIAVAYLLKNGTSHAFQAFIGWISEGKDAKTAFEKAYSGKSWNSLEYGRF